MQTTSFRSLAAGLGLGLVLLAAAGCASGTSRSIAMAPIAFTFIDGGDLLVTRADAAPGAPFAALSGDFKTGVSGYDIVGGNALLPTRPLPVLTTGLLGLPGEVGGLLTSTTTPVVAVLDGGVAGLAGPVPALSSLPPPSGVAPPVIGAASAAPLLAPVTAVTAAAEPTITTLVTQGGGLVGGALAPPPPPATATALASGAVNSVLTVLRRAP